MSQLWRSKVPEHFQMSSLPGLQMANSPKPKADSGCKGEGSVLSPPLKDTDPIVRAPSSVTETFKAIC